MNKIAPSNASSESKAAAQSFPGKGLFGISCSEEESKVIVMSVGFEGTTSYLAGTSAGPGNVLQASEQVDLLHPLAGDAWKRGIYLLPNPQEFVDWSAKAKALAKEIRQSEGSKKDQIAEVNSISTQLNDRVYKMAKKQLEKNKIFSVLGGDHSVPFGSIQAHVEKYPQMGVLHIDAHYDLRKAYEGFENSHASIMFNVLTKTSLKSLTQVAIRDYCEEERTLAEKDSRVKSFLDDQLFEQKASGRTWKELCGKIVESLPKEVYVSFDIDGLSPVYCPGTGTPVPGGLSFREAVYLLREVHQSGRKIIGFDLCEVGPYEYDGNVGSRVLFELSNLSLLQEKS